MTNQHTTEKAAWAILESVCDPEIPVLSIVDLGVVRKLEWKNSIPHLTITPTYSGCPAMKVIEEDVRKAFLDKGYAKMEIHTVLSPAWTTDWLSEAGKKKLKAYGIAPPQGSSEDKSQLFAEPKKIDCPNCASNNTQLKSQFGSTPCKSLYVCSDCLEPFDYFKCL
jgi:ring-1,2-phenylacetyl-CoA epoxidase subunit PaaD